jgi:UPF0716 family protein affecting phage T7 exclusion
VRRALALSDDWLVAWLTGLMALVHACLGAAVLVGGVRRFSLPSYQPLIDLVGGHVWIWGVVAIIAAVLMVVPHWVANAAGLWLGMAWMGMWAALFAHSVWTNPAAVATAMIAYSGYVGVNGGLFVEVIRDQRRQRLARELLDEMS